MPPRLSFFVCPCPSWSDVLQDVQEAVSALHDHLALSLGNGSVGEKGSGEKGSVGEVRLPARACGQGSCDAVTYGAALSCHSCGSRADCCVVTGYPVLPDQRVQCHFCRRPANRADWSQFSDHAAALLFCFCAA